MKNILAIAHSSSLTGGGEEDFLRLLKSLYKKYNVSGVFPEGEKTAEYKKYINDFLVIRNHMFPFTKFGIKSYSGYLIKSYSKVEEIRSFLKDKNIDLIYVHSSVCLYEILAVSKLNIPIVIAVREFINPAITRKIIYKYYLALSEKIIVISKLLEEKFRELNENTDNVILIYPGIENTDLKTSRNKSFFSVLNIGNIFFQKGQDKVISAVSKLRDKGINVKLKIIGSNVDNKYYKRLLRMISDYNLKENVVFTGELPKDEVLKEISKSDCVVVSSQYEGFSLVFLEAISMKKPVVSTEVGVIPEIVKDGENGMIYEFNDTDMLSQKLELLAANENVYKKISENGYKMYENNFTLEMNIQKITDLFESILYKGQ